MHRDVKLGNVGVNSLNPPRAFLIDVDATVIAPTSKDHYKGTLQYLAPEIVALKQHRQPAPMPPPYGHGVDIWALGLCLFALHLNTHFEFKTLARPEDSDELVMTLPVYHKLRDLVEQRLQGLENDTELFLLGMVLRMIEWDSVRRITSSELSSLTQNQLRFIGPSIISPK
jgi:serine/threonine protein kinase